MMDKESSNQFMGSMREDAALLDEIVADAMRRREAPWQDYPIISEHRAALDALAAATNREVPQLVAYALRDYLARHTR